MGVEPKIWEPPPKSSILIGFFIINHPFWGTPIFGKHPNIWPAVLERGANAELPESLSWVSAIPTERGSIMGQVYLGGISHRL